MLLTLYKALKQLERKGYTCDTYDTVGTKLERNFIDRDQFVIHYSD